LSQKSWAGQCRTSRVPKEETPYRFRYQRNRHEIHFEGPALVSIWIPISVMEMPRETSLHDDERFNRKKMSRRTGVSASRAFLPSFLHAQRPMQMQHCSPTEIPGVVASRLSWRRTMQGLYDPLAL
jgi:hypothetical protein